MHGYSSCAYQYFIYFSCFFSFSLSPHLLKHKKKKKIVYYVKIEYRKDNLMLVFLKKLKCKKRKKDSYIKTDINFYMK